MAICTVCGKSPAVGFFNTNGLFVDTISPEMISSLGFKPICRPCAAVKLVTSMDTTQRIGLDEKGNPEGDNSSGDA
jgi:hypothetical protein